MDISVHTYFHKTRKINDNVQYFCSQPNLTYLVSLHFKLAFLVKLSVAQTNAAEL